jgi:hypothetical protein
MTWIYVGLVAVAAISLLRIVAQLRRATRKDDGDWDARFIAQLRKAGVAPFDAHPVDFFFALPTQAACDTLAALLEPEGYHVDSRAEPDGGFSLHAQRDMRLVVADMQALTARFRQLAEERGGKYDGWAVAKARRVPRGAA